MSSRQVSAASLDGGRPEPHAVEVARGRIESALQELTASLGKAQADLASAGEVLGRSRSARLSSEWQPRLSGDPQAVVDPSRCGSTTKPTGYIGPTPNGGAAATGSADDSDGSTSVWPNMHRGSGEESDVKGEVTVDAETLPDTWPATLQIRRWEAQLCHGESSDSLGPTRSSRMVTKVPTGSSDDLVVALRRSNSYSKRHSSTALASEKKGMRHWIVHPNSPGRMIYDILGASFLVFDILAIPVMVAWDYPLDGLLLWAACVTALFWTVDIFMSFITATHRHGELVFDLRTIRYDYMRRWFVPDVVIVLCDWLTLLVLSTTGWRMLRFAKLGRFFRLAAMFRLLKISRIIEEFAEVHLSDIGALTVRFIKMFFLTLMYAHFLACIWFFIGRVGPTSTGVRWTNVESDLGEFTIVFDDQTHLYQYTTSFHWAMSQITLGAMEISCTTTFERIYTVFCLLTGLLFGSTLVSSLSATMLEVQMDKRESHDKMQKMRRYLRENLVNRAIASQVERQLAERLTTKEKLKQDQVLGLQQLSAFLRAQLQFEMLAPYLRSRPLFQLWIHMDIAVVQTFCQECTEFQTLRTQDDLFLPGFEATHAYYFLQGGLTYTQEPESSPVCDSITTTVGENTWLAEAVLWTLWVHVGRASATLYSEVVAVDAAKAVQNVKWTPTLVQVTRDYCRNYHRRLQAAKPPESDWPDDLQVPMTDWCDVVLTMKKDSQVMIGLEALKHAHSGRSTLGGRKVTGLAELTAEVQAGKSTVMLNAKGDLERVVSMVAFKILDECDQILVQLGKQEGAVMKPACQLPGGKQERGEMVSETAVRLLDSKLTPLANHVEVQRTERESFTKESKDFGVKTKYLRNMVLASLDKEVELDHLEVRLPNCDGPDPDDSGGLGRSGRHLPSLTLSLGSAWHGGRNGSPQRQGTVFNFTRQNSFNYSELEKLQNSLQERRAFLFRDRKGMAALYMWASEKEFEHLKSSDFEDMLALVVSQFMVQAHADGLWNADSSPRSP